MSVGDIVAFARAYGAAWASPDSDAFVALFTPDATYRDDQVKRLSCGHDELRLFHAHFVDAISDIRMEFPNAFTDGENACLEWRFSGVQSGSYHGQPPTGTAFRSNGVAVMKLALDGRIRSVVDYYDAAGVKRQLGG
ncbi:nuclear transport factor 2 family protein [Croceicoccus sp. YJ47]|uniref:nuclear transport factor 2 family protein n=1 Tax=Croceicoccus sp. YJ47 TaxID=2798724 RepID=UPI001924A8D4|nr:ester cyclase [Croceicoccus sp. YJ47]QQN75267.1 ester cyclase [Croceicoccus sp. YJ47]